MIGEFARFFGPERIPVHAFACGDPTPETRHVTFTVYFFGKGFELGLYKHMLIVLVRVPFLQVSVNHHSAYVANAKLSRVKYLWRGR